MTSDEIRTETASPPPAKLSPIQVLAKFHSKFPPQWRFHPLVAGEKTPLLKNWPAMASNDPAQLAEWAAEFPGANVGLVTGAASGVWVLDVDGAAGAESLAALTAETGLPPTTEQRTGSGGTHLLFQIPDFAVRNSVRKLGPGLDVRGDAGYVVIAPSVSAKGAYAWKVAPWKVLPAAATPGILSLLRASPAPAQATAAPRPVYLPASPAELEDLHDALEAHGPAVQGHGGDLHTFQAMALVWNDYALPENQGWQVTLEWNATCQPPWSEADLCTKIRSARSSASRPYGCKRKVDVLATVSALISEHQATGSSDPLPLLDKVRALPFDDPAKVELAQNEIKLATGLSKTAQALPKARLRVQDAQGLAEVMVAPTEHGVAQLFEQQHADDLRYCAGLGDAWLHWRETNWERDRTNRAFDFCREVSAIANVEKKPAVARAAFASGVERFAKASRTLATVAEQWDSNEFDLNTPEGTVDLRTGQLRPHNPGDYITRCTQVAPKAGPMPVFAKFMRDITDNDEALIDYHWRSLGACLSGARLNHWLLFWSGEGRNGKNTLGDFVQWLIGSYGKTIPTESLMASKNDRHPTEMANLLGVRIATSSEVPEGSFWNESRLKSLTGDMTISARFMRGNFFEFQRTHKHIIYGNSQPQLRVVDPAMTARLHVVPFTKQFTPELGNVDINLPEKLKAEGPAVLAWLIRGHLKWLKDGTLHKCPAVQRATDDYFESQSTPAMWVTERCDTADPDARTRASTLYSDFSTWKEMRGEGSMSQTRWGEWAAKKFKRVKSCGVATYEGVRLKT